MKTRDAELLEAKTPISETVRRLNPHLYPDGPSARGPALEASAAKVGAALARKEGRRLRQSQEPLLNKLEEAFFARLKAQPCHLVRHLRPQAKRFKLGNGIWYKPDFTCDTFVRRAGAHYEAADQWWPTAFEVKGPKAFRGGFENLKVAAGLWPEVRFVLAWREDGAWKTQEVLP